MPEERDPIRPAEQAQAPSSEEDESLVRRAQGGDARAFEELYRTHVDRVYALCLRMSADRERAEQLTQDTFDAAGKSWAPSGERACSPRGCTEWR